MLHQFWFSGWGFDALYNALFVRPFVFLASINKNDVVDRIYEGVVTVANGLNRLFVFTQNGILRWYLMGIVIGAIVILTIGLMIS